MSRSTQIVALRTVDDLQVWRCPASATDFVWPAPPAHDIVSSDERDAPREPVDVVPFLEAFPNDGTVRYVLDVGCGDGTRLRMAAHHGWKTFGIEPSAAARQATRERHGGSIEVVARADELVPHQFDLVLLLDVLEQVADPYQLFFELFNQGLIGPRTRVVIAVSNARFSGDADAAWPAARLVHFSTRSLKWLLRALLFDDIEVTGTGPAVSPAAPRYADEGLRIDEALSGDPRLLCEATGSRFYAFMQERYVPGTWSKLAEYEHLPRYQYARQFATGARVLDFGCGTGYGARFLSDAASHVVGLDIDAPALDWARLWHQRPNLRYERHDDLGATLAAQSFDLITCFEMIEHVDHEMQKATVRQLARLLTPEGRLCISTPNPAITASYGANPYHLREMDEAQFRTLLEAEFAHIVIVRQWVRPSILIATDGPPGVDVHTALLPADRVVAEPPAFIAICAHRRFDPPPPLCTFDASFDMVLAELGRQETLTGLRFEAYGLRESRDDAQRKLTATLEEVDSLSRERQARAESVRLEVDRLGEVLTSREAVIEKLRSLMHERDQQIAQLVTSLQGRTVELEARDHDVARLATTLETRETELAAALEAHRAELAALEAHRAELAALALRMERRTEEAGWLGDALVSREADLVAVRELAQKRTEERDEHARNLVALRNIRSVRLAHLIRGKSESRAPLLEIVYLLVGGLIPTFLKRRLAGQAAALRAHFAAHRATTDDETVAVPVAAYRIRTPAAPPGARPRILHAIANFMTGGSSRLVVDLIERLGSDYEQRVVTSFIPDPLHYVGADVREVRSPDDRKAIFECIGSFRPDVIHVHYWGDCDEPWYRMVFEAAHSAGVPIIQNINTPVAPFDGVPVTQNVYVSRYVHDQFGDRPGRRSVVYPGSDFTIFAAAEAPPHPRPCIGMVYRLERDKLDEQAIEPFIEAARSLPTLRCLIVGGGSLLDGFRQRVADAGLDANFDFTGYVAYERLPDLYREMDVFVAPIWKESFGQVSAFAMNMGIPVIGYDVGAIPEIVADPALVAPAGDARALANIAVGLITDVDWRKDIAARNRVRAAELFSVEAMIDAYREIYREVLEERA